MPSCGKSYLANPKTQIARHWCLLEGCQSFTLPYMVFRGNTIYGIVAVWEIPYMVLLLSGIGHIRYFCYLGNAIYGEIVSSLWWTARELTSAPPERRQAKPQRTAVCILLLAQDVSIFVQ